MTQAQPLAHVMRGDFLESVHVGHFVVMERGGTIREAWGDPDLTVLPRSSCKMIQALPLVESGAAADLGEDQLALACASHHGERFHVDRVLQWLADLGLDDSALRCGPQPSRDEAYREEMIRAGDAPCQIHNFCSGKHTGFLTLNRHLGADAEYLDPDHPVQVAVKDAFEDMTGEVSPGYGIDGCSAPNHATTLTGLARAMARFAVATDDGDARTRAAARLRDAMMARPDMVAGTGQACTRLMRAAPGKLAVKTGAEGVYIAILPEHEIGIALKVMDGATRAAEAAMAALLVRHGVLDADHPDIQAFAAAPVHNRRDIVTGSVRAAPGLMG